MEWRQWSQELQEVLGLTHLPVAVTYTDRPQEEAQRPRCRACSALHRAAAGEMILLGEENTACPGGSLYLGLRAQSAEQSVRLREFLIRGEKLFSCPAAIFRSMRTGPPPPLGAARYVLFSPLVLAPLRPDVTIILCNPAQAARLVSLGFYESGEAMHCDPTGAACRSIITYPLVTNRFNVSFGDVTQRRSEDVPENMLYVSLPWSHLRSIVASLDSCGAGRAEIDLSAPPEP